MRLFNDRSDSNIALYVGGDSGAICIEVPNDVWGQITHFVDLTPQQKRWLAAELIESADKEENDRY